MISDGVPRIHRVPARFRHLLALGIEDQIVHNHVSERWALAQHRRDGQEGVEPSPRLIEAFADEVGRKVPLEVVLTLERVVPLCVRHRTRVEPGVDDFWHPPHGSGTLLTIPRVLIDVGTVRVEVVSQRPGVRRQLVEAPDPLQMLRLLITHPHRERRTPVPIPRKRPVDVAFEPLTHSALPDFRREPVGSTIVGQHLLLEGGGGGEPRIPCDVDERRFAAPAVWVGVNRGAEPEEIPALFELLNQHRIRVPHEYARHQFSPFDEQSCIVDRPKHGQIVPLSCGVVVRPEGRCDVNDSGTVFGADEIFGDHRPAVPRIIRRGHDFERPGVTSACQLGSLISADNLESVRQNSFETLFRQYQTPSLILNIYVCEIRMHSQARVGRDRPRRRRPDQKSALLGVRLALVRQPGAHEVERGILDVTVPQRNLVGTEPGPAPWTVRDVLVPSV